ncbi:fibronectin type III-like domain-contianing protein [Rathayibacter sp. ZW T2_19]|uniref:Fibronectin type III-like domain-contianing protein n=1 Tax=Rathayibacter rubneri TaxID=2950106 RepID=A0A9X2DVF1_9MICO|nr:fibronectin type III-like domain-contianing protein [Rathayibacter rubneri]MCM6761229.1 fibronectin type III-like domain-contianing protein [Rathayibacter rubneri]
MSSIARERQRDPGRRRYRSRRQRRGHDVHARTVRPARVLLAFGRVPLAPGEARHVSIDIPTALFALWNKRGGWLVEPGQVELFVGRSSADITLKAEVLLSGETYAVEPARRTQASRVSLR